MFKSAEFTREVQRRANEEYVKYKKLQEDVSKTIMFASFVGLGHCDFEIPCSMKNIDFIKRIASELSDLEYDVNSFFTPSVLKLHIVW